MGIPIRFSISLVGLHHHHHSPIFTLTYSRFNNRGSNAYENIHDYLFYLMAKLESWIFYILFLFPVRLFFKYLCWNTKGLYFYSLDCCEIRYCLYTKLTLTFFFSLSLSPRPNISTRPLLICILTQINKPRSTKQTKYKYSPPLLTDDDDEIGLSVDLAAIELVNCFSFWL